MSHEVAPRARRAHAAGSRLDLGPAPDPRTPPVALPDVGSAGRPLAGIARRLRRQAALSLATRFLIVSLVVVAVASAAIGLLVGQQIETSVLNRTAAVTSLYVESIVEPRLQGLAVQARLGDEQIAALSRLLEDTPLGQRVVSFKVWSPRGQILYSPYAPLIGQTFDVDASLARAVRGEVVSHVSDLEDPENGYYERTHWSHLLETYVPVRARGTPDIIAVTEFYQPPDEIEAEVGTARLRAWALVAVMAVLSYLVLARIVKQGSDTIVRQQGELQSKVADLSTLLAQNARLHERVRHAAGASTTLNEQALRRVSADLHDGAGQALGLALLRLDAARARSASKDAVLEAELEIVRDAIRDGLEEMRAVAAGVRLPELETRTVAEVAERAIDNHEQRGGAAVNLELSGVPAEAPHAIKIALFRTLQEALSNAARHGRGVDVAVRLRGEPERLRLEVSDRGPGFDPDQVLPEGHLGLAGMRERARLLGGSFRVDSRPGQGTTVFVSWPLVEPREEWTS